MSSNSSEAPPSRTIDEWLELIPQETAAEIEVTQKVGDTVLIACRNGPNPEVGTLSEREYQVLLLLAQSMSYKEISSALGGISPYTTRTYAHQMYQKLGVPSRVEAAQYVPIEERVLAQIPLHKVAKMPPRQRKMFEAAARAANTKQVATEEVVVTASTVRAHRVVVRRLLGGLKDGVALSRVAGAVDNMRRYAGRHVDEIWPAACILQPLVSKTIKDLDENHDPARLTDLTAALLMRVPETRELMDSLPTSFIARTIIDKEVEYFLRHRDEALDASQAA